jgi:hypothetical protein
MGIIYLFSVNMLEVHDFAVNMLENMRSMISHLSTKHLYFKGMH